MINLNRVDLNLLVVFSAIAKEGSITRAGEKLNLTQPAVSHALARLRITLGDALFVRQGKLMVATPAARALLDPIRRALGEIELSLNQLEYFDPATTNRVFKVGMRHAVEAIVLPNLAVRFRLAAPMATLVSTGHDRNRLEQDLGSGAIDVGVDVRLPPAAGVSARPLRSTKLLVAYRERHPLLHDVGTLDLRTYLTLDHILVSSRRSGPASEDVALAARRKERKVVMRCANPWSALQSVALSDMVATVHVSDAAELVGRFDGVRFLPAPVEMAGTQLYLYSSERRHDEASIAWLCQLIADGL